MLHRELIKKQVNNHFHSKGELDVNKRLSLIMMSLGLSFLLLAGCSGKPSTDSSAEGASGNQTGSKEQITLTFMERWPNEPYKTYFDEVIAEFEKQNPGIKIDASNAVKDGYDQKLKIVLGSKNPPDIFMSYAGEFGKKFIRDGVALDLSGEIAKDKAWSDQILPAQFEPFSHEGKIYGVPFFMDAKLFFYNKDIFDNLNIKPPSTFSEFLQILETIKKNNITPIAFGNKASWAGDHYLTTLNQRMVTPEAYKQDSDIKTAAFTDPGYITALEKMQQLLPYFNSEPNARLHADARNAFLNGQAAMMYMESTELRFFINDGVKFKWGTFDFPTVEGGKGNPDVLTGAPEGFMISSKSKHPEEAMKFLKFLISKPMAEKLVKEAAQTPAVIGAVNEQTAIPEVIQIYERLANAKEMAVWLGTAQDVKVGTPYVNGFQELIGGTKTPQQVMDEVHSALK